ncbi:tRNA pseudouridine13 synthase [Fistulifera solaris]|uniref:tRNA pseudouridine13 synthase n=1 Tax=Fistulifera solaris TaxID=1519565 RepID=A0A1Z5KRC1_FISSO|nr:tRNA pseudouridine13 synthase [Fistulifera solaris]|eukprot:GAX28655.1 tRNA pseudouridine13 synthase [Fistulifera solaris]
MGDVFVTAPPHDFPSSYLSSKQQGDASFDSWEILGSIKTTAEDFVVREIACDEKKHPDAPRIADLNPFTCNAPAIPTSATEKGQGLEHIGKECHKSPIIVKDDSSASTDERSLNQILSDCAFQVPPSETIQEIDNLHNAAVELLRGTSEDCGDVIDITFLEVNEASVSLRGAFHKAIRRDYPLLQSDTKPAGPDNSRRLSVSISTRFLALRSFLDNPQEDLIKLYRYFNRGYEASIKDGGEERVLLRLRKDLPREDRRIVHEAIQKGSHGMFQTFTIPDYKMHVDDTKEPITVVVVVVQWSRQTARKRKRVQRNSPESNLLFVVRKRGKEHLATIQTLVRALRCRQADIGLAGIKDMHAVTYQFCTVSNVSSNQLKQAAESLSKNGIDIGPSKEVPWRLSKGDLYGNHFQITIRDLRRVTVANNQEGTKALDITHFQMMVDRIRNQGFVNFFGEQRVGVAGTASIVGVRSFDIGRAMLQCDFIKAVDLLMTGRRVTRGDDVENDEVVRFRQEWQNIPRDLNKCWKALPKGNKLLREQTVLQGLKRYGSDKPLEALRCLHHNERTFWVSAYQSYLWNIAATERLRVYGMNVVQGDLVDEGGHIKVVDEKDTNKFSIYQVVLPLVGTSTLFPQNAVRFKYEKILTGDGISFSKTAPSESLPKGGYRHVLAKCDDLAFEIRENDTDKSIRVVTLSFELPRGCYATSLLRELMVTTVDRTFSLSASQRD